MGNAHFRLMMSINHSTQDGNFGTPNWNDNTRGSIWMLLSMVAFSIEDVFLKQSAGQVPIGQVLVVFGAAGAVLFAMLCLVNRQNPIQLAYMNRAMLMRFAFETAGRLFFTLSLALTAISSTVAILQAAPLVVVAGAAILLGEKVSLTRWLAILAGLVGVLIVLRPTTDSFSWLSFLGVLGMLGLSLRDLATRAIPKAIPNTVLGLHSFIGVMAAGAIYTLWSGGVFILPDAKNSAFLLGAAVLGVAGYLSLTTAMRTGEVSVVTPFRYTRLICGALLGVAIFGEDLDVAIVVGSALIVVSGSFVLLRTRSKGSEKSQND